MMAARDVVVITAMVFLFAVVFLTSHYTLNQAFDRLQNNTVINASQPTVTVLDSAQDLTSRFDYIIFAIFITLALALIITGWFIGGHPIFMFIYFIIVVVGTVLGAVFANAWETISTKAIFAVTLSSFPLTNHILNALPIYTAIIGFIGIVVMFGKPFIVRQE